jgi:hypothetical protein
MLGRKKSVARKSGKRSYSPTSVSIQPSGIPVVDADYEYYVEVVSPLYPHMAGKSVTELIAEMQDDGWDYVSQTPLGADINVTFRRLRHMANRSGPIIIPRRSSAREFRRGCGTYILMVSMILTIEALHIRFVKRNM